jgi:pantetheine-phosphate adenylyltransferase
VKRPVIAVYPGSFDPVTRGHEEIALRSLKLVDELIIAVAHTSSQRKRGLFDVEERLELLEQTFAGEPRVRCVAFKGLLVDFCRAQDARIVIRGLRAVSDFEYELQLAQMNQELWGELETVFLTPDVHHSFVSASLVREVARLGGDVSSFVSPPVLARIQAAVARGD